MWFKFQKWRNERKYNKTLVLDEDEIEQEIKVTLKDRFGDWTNNMKAGIFKRRDNN